MNRELPDDARISVSYDLVPGNLKTQGHEERIAALERELERTRNDMRAFSYSVSHDLRAPLRAIEGFGRILQEDYASALDDEGKKFLDHVLSNAQLMSAQIDDLLAFHRLGEKPVTPVPIKLGELVSEVLAAAKASDARSEIKLPQLPTIHGDPVLIRTAFEQLIDNAIKFSKREPKAVIEFGAKVSDGHQVLWVRDNGIGFDMNYGDKLFQVFQKLQRDADFEGNGIGLALVKRIAEKHQGRVWAEASPGGGATFFFAIPKSS